MSPEPPPRSVKVFIGPCGLRAGRRFFLFAMLAAMLIEALSFATSVVAHSIIRNTTQVIDN